jgi:hypothetical protein
MLDAYERVYRALIDERSGQVESPMGPDRPVMVPVAVGGSDRVTIDIGRRTRRGADDAERSVVN